jgi:hypothetical protein
LEVVDLVLELLDSRRQDLHFGLPRGVVTGLVDGTTQIVVTAAAKSVKVQVDVKGSRTPRLKASSCTRAHAS